MLITPKKVQELAALVRIDICSNAAQDKELEIMAQKLEAELINMKAITKVDLSNVAPLYAPTEHLSSLRPDLAEKQRGTAAMLKNAPEHFDNYFVVPPVL